MTYIAAIICSSREASSACSHSLKMPFSRTHPSPVFTSLTNNFTAAHSSSHILLTMCDQHCCQATLLNLVHAAMFSSPICNSALHTT